MRSKLTPEAIELINELFEWIDFQPGKLASMILESEECFWSGNGANSTDQRRCERTHFIFTMVEHLYLMEIELTKQDALKEGGSNER